MIDALVAGKLHTPPEQRLGKHDSPYVTAKVRAASSDGDQLIVNVIAFDPASCAALLALGAGDSVAISGSITPKVWTDREGQARPALDMVAQQVMTAYQVAQKR